MMSLTEPTMRIAIVGSRGYPRLDLVAGCVTRLAEWSIQSGTPLVIVSGTEPTFFGKKPAGVDETAIRAARKLRIETVVYPANWTLHGQAAGILRNKAIVENSDALIAFWDLTSPGTADSVRKALVKGSLRKVYGPDGDEVPVDMIGDAVRQVLGE